MMNFALLFVKFPSSRGMILRLTSPPYPSSGFRQTLDVLKKGIHANHVEERLTVVTDRLTKLEERLLAVGTGLEEWKPYVSPIPELAEKIVEVRNWKQVGITIALAAISGLLGWFLRGRG